MKIPGVYTLFNRIDIYRDDAGGCWTCALWARDLLRHLDYIPDFRLCSPVSYETPPAGFVKIAAGRDFEIIALRPDRGWLSVFANLLPNFVTVLRAVKSTDIAHSGGAGWAFPNSFYLVLIRPFVRFRWIIVIESMFWKVERGEKASLRRRIGLAIHDVFLKAAVRRADVRIFTHEGYKRYFLPDGGDCLINPASWIDADDIAACEALQRRQAGRDRAGPLRLLFASRLVPEKGLQTLAAALERLKDGPFSIELVILGDGPMGTLCDRLAADFQGPVTVRREAAIPYGPELFAFIRTFDAVVVPAMSSEQPRLIYDAMSQGVPVIVSATEGNLSCVDSDCALIFEPGDDEDLARRLKVAARDIEALQKKGLRALDRVRGVTHGRMHADRSRYLAAKLGGAR